MKATTILFRLVALGLLVTLTSGSVAAQDNGGTNRVGWCGATDLERLYVRYDGDQSLAAACFQNGICDDPLTRDLYLPLDTQQLIFVNCYMHVFREDDGSNPAASEADIIASIDQVNQNLLEAGIQLNVTWRYVNSSQYRSMDRQTEDGGMKAAFAINPTLFLNIYVTEIIDPTFPPGQIILGYANTPWQSVAQTTNGGCVLNDVSNGGFGPGSLTFAHEIGHNLGLYHTFRGVDEVGQCGACYESPDNPDNDNRGDFCSDTRPTPTNFSCNEPGGGDPCTATPWAPTPISNIMGYSNDACVTEFSTQQMARMRCWSLDAVETWIEPLTITTGDTIFGEAPLTVEFAGHAPRRDDVAAWMWEFGDGGMTDTARIVSHTYTVPGARDVYLEIDIPGVNQSKINDNAVFVHADTIKPTDVQAGASQPFFVDITVENSLPLTEIILPIQFGQGLWGLSIDSVLNTGTRTDGWDVDTLFGPDQTERFVVILRAPAGDTLQAGSGSLLRLWSKMPFIELPGSESVTVEPLVFWDPEFTTIPGIYTPQALPNTITFGCCSGTTGDVNCDGSVGLPDLSTLIDHLFITFTPLCCDEEANIDGTGGVGLPDLSVLIDNLFISFTPLPSCP